MRISVQVDLNKDGSVKLVLQECVQQCIFCHRTDCTQRAGVCGNCKHEGYCDRQYETRTECLHYTELE